MDQSTAYPSIATVMHAMRHERAYGVTDKDDGHSKVYAFRTLSAAKNYRASLLAQHNLRGPWQSSAFPCWYLLLNEGRMCEMGNKSSRSRHLPIIEMIWMDDPLP